LLDCASLSGVMMVFGRAVSGMSFYVLRDICRLAVAPRTPQAPSLRLP
jgi:hypothetical protein